MGLASLLRGLGHERQHAVVSFRLGERTFRAELAEGGVSSASFGALEGEEAIYRAVAIDADVIETRFGVVPANRQLAMSLSSLLEEAERRAEVFRKILRTLPGLEVVLFLDRELFGEHRGALPDEIVRVATLVDGSRTVFDVLDASPFDDISTLAILRKLRAEAFLTPTGTSERSPESGSFSNPGPFESFTKTQVGLVVDAPAVPGLPTQASSPIPEAEQGDAHRSFVSFDSGSDLIAEEPSSDDRQIDACDRDGGDCEPLDSFSPPRGRTGRTIVLVAAVIATVALSSAGMWMKGSRKHPVEAGAEPKVPAVIAQDNNLSTATIAQFKTTSNVPPIASSVRVEPVAAGHPAQSAAEKVAESAFKSNAVSDEDRVPLAVRVTKALEASENAKALRLATELTLRAPGSASAWHLRGAAEQAIGRSGKASFRKCAALAPKDSALATECQTFAE